MKKIFAILLAAIGIASCGGGASTTTTLPPPPPPPPPPGPLVWDQGNWDVEVWQ